MTRREKRILTMVIAGWLLVMGGLGAWVWTMLQKPEVDRPYAGHMPHTPIAMFTSMTPYNDDDGPSIPTFEEEADDVQADAPAEPDNSDGDDTSEPLTLLSTDDEDQDDPYDHDPSYVTHPGFNVGGTGPSGDNPTSNSFVDPYNPENGFTSNGSDGDSFQSFMLDDPGDDPGDDEGDDTDPTNPGDDEGDDTDPNNPGDDEGDDTDPTTPGDDEGDDTGPTNPNNPGDDEGDDTDPTNPGDDEGDDTDPNNPGDDEVGDTDPTNPGDGENDNDGNVPGDNDPENPGDGPGDDNLIEIPGDDDEISPSPWYPPGDEQTSAPAAPEPVTGLLVLLGTGALVARRQRRIQA